MFEAKKEKENKKQIVQDPVCGMWIEPKDAAAEIIYNGKIFYFCAPGCKREFENEPEKYLHDEEVNFINPEYASS